MDLALANIKIHPKWELIEATPEALYFKSPYIDDPNASIEITAEGNRVYGLVKSSSNRKGSEVIIGKGLPIELTLMLIVDVLAEGIFEYNNC